MYYVNHPLGRDCGSCVILWVEFKEKEEQEMVLVLWILLGVCVAVVPLSYILYCWHGNAWRGYDKACIRSVKARKEETK